VIHRVDHPTAAGTWIQLRRADGRLVSEWKFDLWPMRTVFKWAPDGNSVVVPARDSRERPGFMRIDLETGELSMVRRLETGGEAGRVFAISLDGRMLYFTRHPIRDGVLDESFAEIVAHDLTTGEEKAIRRVHGHGNVTISPDGEWLALATGTRTGETIQTTLQVVASDGSEARTVYRGAGADSPRPVEPDAQPVGDVLFCQCQVVGWSPDSRSVLFLDLVDDAPDTPSDVELLRVPLDGSAVERVATILDYDAGAVLHPDGRTIAYRTGRSRGEIWALEVLPASVETDAHPPDGGTP
jgi:Tol biopolymer transport system component